MKLNLPQVLLLTLFFYLQSFILLGQKPIEPPSLIVQPVKIEIPEADYRLMGKKFQFSHFITRMKYAPGWGLVSLNFGESKNNATYALLDTENDTIRWSRNGFHQFQILHTEE